MGQERHTDTESTSDVTTEPVEPNDEQLDPIEEAEGTQAPNGSPDAASSPAAEDVSPTEESPGSAEASIQALEKELAETQDRLLRTAAEYQNYRRRTQSERATAIEFGRIEAVQQLLEVYDDLRRSIGAGGATPGQALEPGPALEALKAGVALVYEKFAAQMQKLGVEPIEAVGRPFDENLHDALLQQPAPEGTQPGTVLAEIQRGYRMGERILRHSQVIVAV